MTAEDFDTELNTIVDRLISGFKAVQSIYERDVTALMERAETAAVPDHLAAASVTAAQGRINKEMAI